MRFGSVGAVVAAGRQDAAALLQTGGISMLRRIVLTLQCCGAFPVVVVTGPEEWEAARQLAPLGVVFIREPEGERPELFSSAKRGLSYLQGKCGRIVFAPVHTPMFCPQTLEALLRSGADIAVPVCGGRGGHPVVLAEAMLPEILSYEGEGGLRGAIRACRGEKQRLPVPDAGVLMLRCQSRQRRYLHAQGAAALHPRVTLTIERETALFGARLKLLLFLLADMGSVRRACLHMGLSCQKAWDMLNRLEQAVGYAVVARQRGGRHGGKTLLTQRGQALTESFARCEQEVSAFARQRFDRWFRETGLIGAAAPAFRPEAEAEK